MFRNDDENKLTEENSILGTGSQKSVPAKSASKTDLSELNGSEKLENRLKQTKKTFNLQKEKNSEFLQKSMKQFDDERKLMFKRKFSSFKAHYVQWNNIIHCI